MKRSYLILIALLFLMSSVGLNAQETQTTKDVYYKALAATLSVGIAAVASAYAVAKSAEAAIAAISEDPRVFGKVVVFVGLAEGIAIYGLLVSILIIFIL